MRPFITCLLVVGLLAGVYCYTNFANSVRPEAIEYKATYATGKYSIRLSRTFDCVADTDFGNGNALEVVFKDKKVLQRSDKVDRNEPITVELPDVEVGRNAVYIEANLPSSFSLEFGSGGQTESQSHAMRAEILKDKSVIAKESFWIATGLDSVSGTISFSVKATDENESEKEHDHDH